MRGRGAVIRLVVVAAVCVAGTIVAYEKLKDGGLKEDKSFPRPVVAKRNEEPRGHLLLREIFRQSWLIAQRDGLGLRTRDSDLREPAIADVRGVPDLNVRYIDGGDSTFEAAGQDGSRGWKISVATKTLGNNYADTVVAAERLSRKEFIDGLTSMGFHAATTAPAGGVADLTDAKTLLEEMNVCAQFDAVRLAHAAARKTGLSGEAIGVLVRGYANLGQLTRCLWADVPQVMAARSLIYAQRMVEATPVSDPAAKANALRHRAYAFAMTGLDVDALADVEAADKLDGATNVPAWAALIRPLAKYQTRKLTDATVTAPHDRMQLPAFLTFLSVIHTNSVSAINDFGRTILKTEPNNVRVVDVMSEISGVAGNHELTEEALNATAQLVCTRVQSMHDVPRSVMIAARDAANAEFNPTRVAAVPKALIEAGESDPGEPSWAALGRIFQETDFRNVYRRISFEGKLWNIDPSPSLAALKPLVVGHPYYPALKLLATFPMDPRRGRELVKGMKIIHPQFKMIYFVQDMEQAGVTPLPSEHHDLRTLMSYYRDDNACDAEVLYALQDKFFKNHAVEILKHFCPSHPAVLADRVFTDWPASEGEAIQYVDEGGSPIVAAALGRSIRR